MDTTLYVSLSHQAAMRRRLDVIAHNIANMNTTAFKKESIAFQQFLVDQEGLAPTVKGQVAYVQDYGLVRDTKPGTFIPTDNPLDVAIEGRAYLAVRAPSGEVFYTRNGRMRIDGDGLLTTLNGERVLDDDNQEIALAPDDTDIAIARDGTISSQLGPVGKLQLAAFADEQRMKRVGNSLYETDEAPRPAEDAVLLQRTVEGSNVNAIEETTLMIDVMRSYQSVQRSLDSYQELRKRAIDRLARVQ